jgi:hypothetical protein
LGWNGRSTIPTARGMVYMEAIVRPFMPADGSSELGPTFMALRSDQGEELILNQNILSSAFFRN